MSAFRRTFARKTQQPEQKRISTLGEQEEEVEVENAFQTATKRLKIGRVSAINVMDLAVGKELTMKYDRQNLHSVLTPAVGLEGHNQLFLVVWRDKVQYWGLELDRKGNEIAEWTNEELLQVCIQ